MMSLNEPERLPQGIADLCHVICGCSIIENTWGVIQAELERCERFEYKADVGIAACVCDYFQLTEHGTAIRGGWLTDKGKEALAFFRKYGIDWKDKGEFVDSDDCHWGSFT